ncbi:MAG: hypothetical protein ABSC46_12025 [Candidatus Limnocylindrales bacterium]
MSSQPRAFLALDRGSSTTSGAVLGHVGGRWRLIAHAAAPSHVDADAILGGLLARIGLTDPEMLLEMGAEGADVSTLVATWPRLVARTTPERRLAVLAGSRRQRRRLEAAALRAGWLVAGGSADEDDPVALSRLALSPDTAAVLLGADRSPSGDEKRHLPELAALVAAVTRSRPELAVVLAGGAAAHESAFTILDHAPSGYPPAATRPVPASDLANRAPVVAATEDKEAGQSKMAPPASKAAMGSIQPAEPETAADGGSAGQAVSRAEGIVGEAPAAAESGTAEGAEEEPARETPASSSPVSVAASDGVPASPHVLLAPDAEAGQPAGASLQQVLEGLRALANDSRLGVARSIASLAYVLDRPIEVVEIGLQGGLRARSEPLGQGHFSVVSSHACLAEASFAPMNPSEEVIDGVLAWSTVALDRHRAMDRLNDLRLMPWGEADGDGAVFRLAAAKAAFGRLVEATPELADQPLPELLIAAGGVFAALPPSVVALALADLVRRPGVSQIAIDQARLLGPLGAIEDESERRRVIANLADDILMPAGGLILPAGVRPGRSAGQIRLKDSASTSEIELHPGAVQVIDLPPGRTGRADLEFRDAVRMPQRAHQFSVEVGGGLGGLLVDLRDIPMRISDRPDSRRAALDAWQRGMWPETDE